MAHFIKLENGVVTDVINTTQQKINMGVFGDASSWQEGYAGLGFTYNSENNVFIAPQPFPSWVLNDSTFNWVAPVAHPEDGKRYTWDELTMSWVEIPTA